jgi:hypothetical protein
MSRIEQVLEEAVRQVNQHVRSPDLETISSETNVFDAVDSMAIVDLLLESESLLEEATGRYVALANDKTFDASESPLLRWSDWVAHVEQRHAE